MRLKKLQTENLACSFRIYGSDPRVMV